LVHAGLFGRREGELSLLAQLHPGDPLAQLHPGDPLAQQ